MHKFEFGKYVWYDGGTYKAYNPGVYKIVDFFGTSYILLATTVKDKVQRVVASPGQCRELTVAERTLYAEA